MKINRRNFLGAIGTGTAALSLDALATTKIIRQGENASHNKAAETAAGKKVTILLAHPNYPQSVANKTLVEAVKNLPGLTVIDIYASPFTLDTYKKAVGEAATIVFQFPFHWLSAPSMLKKWCDEIFGGLLEDVKGKQLLVATTTGSEYEAYRSGGRNLFTIDELLRPYQALANHAGMSWHTPFALYGATLPTAPASIAAGAKAYKELIGKLLSE
ncbi:MAG: NAD(P)H-dependent oxidoreductase [Tannerellaceae bacterium]|jgi:glutathione-regulated potassium-efflux system ancillary protein KefG|nr:NAD(P)H-dependent oxidoreductase [Tannerellaceae bacterium]